MKDFSANNSAVPPLALLTGEKLAERFFDLVHNYVVVLQTAHWLLIASSSFILSQVEFIS